MNAVCMPGDYRQTDKLLVGLWLKMISREWLGFRSQGPQGTADVGRVKDNTSDVMR